MLFSIAVDGPAGAGKSSVAKEIAKRLNIYHMDTGALYRAIAYYFIGLGALENYDVVLNSNLEKSFLNIKYLNGLQNIFLGDINITNKIRTEEVAKFASSISSILNIRKYILKIERDFAKKNSVIMDGRDIGTVVLPNASLKIFLTASVKIRAKRRCYELAGKGEEKDFFSVLYYIIQRDKKDRNRKIAPLKAARDSVIIDTTDLSLDGTVDKVMELVNKKVYKNIG